MSNASMRIIRKLPPIPRPATKPRAYPNLYGEGIWIHEVKPQIPSHMEIHEQAASARARLMGKAEKKHDMVRRLAKEGMSDADIAQRTGYRPESVRKILWRMRKEGLDAPERERGRKSEKSM